MIKKNSEEKVFDLVHPLYQHDYNQLGVPIMNKVTEDMLDFSKVQPLNVQNLSIKNNNTRKLVLGFSHDDKIERFYNYRLWRHVAGNEGTIRKFSLRRFFQT